MPLLVSLTSLLLSFVACPAGAQSETIDPAIEKLEQEFSDPLTTLPQVFTQDAYTPANYGTAAPTNRVIARLIVPRIPRYSLLPFVQLIRPSFSLVTVPTGRGAATRTAFGDMQIFVLDVIDTAAERKRLEAELANIDKQVASISGKLSNEGFTSRAPANVVQAERDKLTDLQSRREVVVKTLAEL